MNTAATIPESSVRRWIMLALALVTIAVYSPVRHHDFIDYDDPCYVSENALIQEGFTAKGFAFAFFKLHGTETYWHPLTWVSHMIDCEVFGANPGPHHIVNVIFHILNVGLLFTWLIRMTDRLWPSAVARMLFAFHPIQVDTVAWVAERKNLLSGMFWMLALISFTEYAKGNQRKYYLIALGLFALGLLCKPAIVTLPCVFLLLDYWPFNRFRFGASGLGKAAAKIVLEKVPFFALSLASSLVTIEAHKGLGLLLPEERTAPLMMRLGNCIVAYGRYLVNVVWPVKLSVVYPYQAGWPAETILTCLALLAAITGVAIYQIKKRPYLLMGWCWFLGTLVPTIGIVQAGHQSMADRFMYLPIAGILIAGVWLMAEFSTRCLRQWFVTPLAVTAAAVACLSLTARQVGYWVDTPSLFQHAVEVTENNWVAHNILGGDAVNRKNFAAADHHLRIAERLSPDNQHIKYFFGFSLVQQGRYSEAEGFYANIIRINPKHSRALNDLGFIRMRQGRLDEAKDLLERALRIEPDLAKAQTNLLMITSGEANIFRSIAEADAKLAADPGNVELVLRSADLKNTAGLDSEAVEAYRKVLSTKPAEVRALLGLASSRIIATNDLEVVPLLEKVIAIQPMSYEAHYQLGGIRERQERLDDAQRHFRTAAQSKPDSLDALSSLGILSFRLGKMSDAFETFDTLARTHAGDAEFHMRAGLAAASLQRTADAIRHLNEAQRLRPSWPPPLYTLAWLLATHPDATQRNGTDALKLANRTSELTQSSNPRCLDVLAAALAETGNFAEAAAMQRKAITVAAAASPPMPVDEFKLRLELYQGGKAYRQPRVESPKP